MRLSIVTNMTIEIADRLELQRIGCTGSGTNKRVRTRGAKLFVIAKEEVCGSVSNVPLKGLNNRAIEIADSHGGNSSVWYRNDVTGAVWLNMYRSTQSYTSNTMQVYVRSIHHRQ